MANFRDLDEFFDPTLKLPVGGKTYVIQPPSAEVGLLCQRLMQASIAHESGQDVDGEGLNKLAQVVLDDDQERDLYQRILGATFDELVADGVDWAKVQHVGTTALVWVAAGEDAAAKIWEDRSGEAAAPNRATRRSTAAAARSTRSRGSATTTTRATASRSTKAAPRRGKTS
ncbi:hypothetical protein GCM10023194_81410 [Planotetraspora phitsanulokensis]|uniref:DUF7426 domain-containing protein n=1 Tax=Planotetraspora phitsanulokensis TaxID=575192 RepID=A0A8J3UCG5_9ACTN|nr:hypothetical protein [Planotetraspora phitsanulokensis]GII42928.1 hypothetical protein Pph01_79310 [Planotetraspora phitsanulokensis]